MTGRNACRARYRALILDMDGTVTRPVLDFGAIRREIGILSGDLAREIGKLPADRRKRAWAVVERHEARAMREQELQDGARELLVKCRTRSVKLGLVTRNARRSVDHLCKRFDLRFDAVVTREFPFLKPHPAPILKMLAQWRMEPGDALVVGDYRYDIESGRAAGAHTCFFRNPGVPFSGEDADHVVGSMAELGRLVFGE